MRTRSFFLCFLGGLSVLLPGCVTSGGPSPPSRPEKIASSSLPPSPAKKPPRAPEHPVVLPPSSPVHAPLHSACGTITRSPSGQWLDFLIAGRGILPTGASDKAVLARAEKNAVDRLDRCSGITRRLSAFYEGNSVSSPQDKRKILAQLGKILDLSPRFHMVRESCHDAGKNRSCDAFIEGRLRRLRPPDSGFLLHTSGLGQSGLLREGESIRLRIFSSRSARVYLVDVDDRGQGVLLDPEPLPGGLSVPAGTWITYPPDTQKSLSLLAALPPKIPRTAGHLWVVAREDSSPLPEKLRPEAAKGSLSVLKDFFGGFLSPIVHSKAGWTFKVIPYEIVRASPPSSGSPAPPIR
ncbi:MAG: hypothetical protein ACP5OS_09220 [Leptospirillia bacterium]